MPALKQGDLIKDEDGNTRKVLGVCGEVVFVSDGINYNDHSFTQTEEKLKERGYTWDTPAWEPELHKRYWYLHERGSAYEVTWLNDEIDNDCRDFLGIYQTKELAEAALLEIRRKLGK